MNSNLTLAGSSLGQQIETVVSSRDQPMHRIDYKNFFPQVLEIAQNSALNLSQRAEQLEVLRSDRAQHYPLNLHAYKITISTKESELFWKMLQCKAVNPTLVVSRITTCPVTEVYDGIKHFKRAPWIEGTPAPMSEEVFIDQESRTILFIAEATHFVAINRLIKDQEGHALQGIYFDGIKERPKEAFDASVLGLVSKIKEYMVTGKVDQLYQENVLEIEKRKN